MDVDLSSDFWRLKDGHGLHDKRIFDPERLTDLPYARGICDFLEYFIVLMEGMSNFVDRLSFRDNQLSIYESFRLEEEADFAARVQKILAHPV